MGSAASSKLDDGAYVKGSSSIYEANPELSHSNIYEPIKDENETTFKAQNGDKLSSSLLYESVELYDEIGVVKNEFEFSSNAAYGCSTLHI